MNDRDAEGAVRHVLPAVNLYPSSFQLERGLVRQVQRDGTPVQTSLDGMDRQLVLVGVRHGTDLGRVAYGAAADAVASLPRPARHACDQLVVCWADPSGQAFAAAFALTSSAEAGELRGASWIRPEEWPEPMPDVTRSREDAIAFALARVHEIVSVPSGMDSVDALDRALLLVSNTLTFFGGEGQTVDASFMATASDAERSAWLEDYSRSVRDEWHRIEHGVGSVGPVAIETEVAGPLSGMSVFLSYARPDAVALAWPVRAALSSLGAHVWFDQTEELTVDRLTSGLAETISQCDAYVMCATDEFFERSGYATQELAWALEHSGPNRQLRRLVAVTVREAVLPRKVGSWPRVEPLGLTRDELARRLQASLQAPPPIADAADTEALSRSALPETGRLALSGEADLTAMRRRASHVLRFLGVDMNAAIRLVADGPRDQNAHVAATHRQLLGVSDRLDWNGHLDQVDTWPEDPLVRDIRLRLGTLRTMIGARWPFEDDFDAQGGVAADIDYLAMQRVAPLAWPSASGWDDSARRLVLRDQAGRLRVIEEMLRRGLALGLIDVPIRRWDIWADELRARRRECLDALLALRELGQIGWQVEPPEWDRLFRAWRQELQRSGSWDRSIPGAVQQVVIANATSVAAVAAETGWHVARGAPRAVQWFDAHALEPVVRLEIIARSDPSDEDVEVSVNCLRLGWLGWRGPSPRISVSWNVPSLLEGAAVGRASAPAPPQVASIMSLSRS